MALSAVHPRVALVLTIFGGCALVVSAQTCPANGGPGCASPDAIPAKDLQCAAWRQTGNCDPNGPREAHGDRPCNAEISLGSSGYCECGGGRRARQVDCGHLPFTCDAACKDLVRYACVGWRGTSGCSADGPRVPAEDATCDEEIGSHRSGFCECGGGRTVRRSGCDQGAFLDSFRCRDACGREPSLYEELGLEPLANDKAIKQAFRKLSLKYHPDKTRNDPVLSERFGDIRQAYDVLSDPEQRALYDIGGLDMVSKAKSQQMQKGPPMSGEVHVGLEDLYNGQELKRAVMRKVICSGCSQRWTPKCNQCNAGCANEIQLVQMQMGMMIVQQQQEVPSSERCRMQHTELTLEVEPGMSNGDKITFKGMGEQQPKKIPGDVELVLKEIKHHVFRRAGNDLHAEIDISLKEALLGFEFNIRQLDGRNIQIKVDSITKPYGYIQVDGEGMPHRGDPTQHGNLYIRCRVTMPKDDAFTESQRQWLRENFPA